MTYAAGSGFLQFAPPAEEARFGVLILERLYCVQSALDSWAGKWALVLCVMDTSWKFDQPPNCAVFTVRRILERCEPVLHVTHDVDDHGWQFLGMETPTEADARIVALEEMLEIDPSLWQLADLPVGWHAWRHSGTDDWVRELNPDLDAYSGHYNEPLSKEKRCRNDRQQ